MDFSFVDLLGRSWGLGLLRSSLLGLGRSRGWSIFIGVVLGGVSFVVHFLDLVEVAESFKVLLLCGENLLLLFVQL
jgi:hypothetical protein